MPYNTGHPPILGEFYIQNENQDFWLYEMKNGVPQWVRKGNIRDEGTSGLITVPPVWSLGVDMSSLTVDRWRYVNEAAPVDLSLGFSTDILALERIRYLAPVNCQLGLAVSVAALQRIKNLTAAFALGAATQAQLTRTVQVVAAMSLGAQMATTLDAGVVHNIAAAMTVGFDQATGDPYRSRMINVGFGVGFNKSAALTKTEYLVVAQSLGLAMAAAVSRVRVISADFALGLSQTTAVTGYFGTKYIPTNTVFAGSATPTAVDTTFTYGLSGASQGHLYDGDITTPAADPDGVSSSSSRTGLGLPNPNPTHAAYDLGSDTVVTGVTIYTAPANGFSSSTTFKVQYSDAGLTGPWTDVDTIVVPPGTSQVASSSAFSAGAHRYWQIVYLSGNTTSPNNNAWVGELVFGTSYAPWSEGASMSVTLQRVKSLPSVSMAEGLSMAVAVAKLKAVAASMGLGASMAVTGLSRSRFLTVAMALGSSQANTVTHGLPSGTVYTPSAVLTTFTFTGQSPPASQAALYDGNDSTDAADARGLQTDTSAAYDLGTARTIGSVRVVNSPRFVSTGNITYKVQYSDTGLSGAWTDAGASVTMTTATGNVQTASIGAVGAHRYWRIVYVSGNINSNAWLGELQFKA